MFDARPDAPQVPTALPLPLALRHGAVLEKGRDAATVSFAYIFTGNESKPANDRGIIAIDSISFYVADIDGAYSSVANITIEVTRGLYALPSTEITTLDEAPDKDDSQSTAAKLLAKGTAASKARTAEYCVGRTVLEENWGALLLGGADNTRTAGNISFAIVSLPMHGTLRDPLKIYTNENGEKHWNPLSEGDVLTSTLAHPYSGGVVVEYLSDENYFNSPQIAWNGSAVVQDGLSPTENMRSNDGFTYKVFRTNDRMITSTIAYQEVIVINVNDEPKLTVTPPDGGVHRGALRTGDAHDDDANYVSDDGKSSDYTWHVNAVTRGI